MSQKRILIIDDNQDLAVGLAMVLEGEGYAVKTAYGGEEGFDEFQTQHYDMVFIDVKLPGINGVEVFQRLNNTSPSTKVIMMTGYRMEQMLTEIADTQSVIVIRESLEMDAVLKYVQQTLNRSIVLMSTKDPEYAAKLLAFLNDQGVVSRRAQNSSEAIDAVSSSGVEVLLLDLHEPVIYALGLYLEVIQDAEKLKTIIISHTGVARNCSSADVFKTIEVTGCLFKPFKPEVMLQSVKTLLASDEIN